MASVEFLARPRSTWADERYVGKVILFLIFSAICFNAVLSVVNAHLTEITGRTVAFSEVLIVGAAILVGYRSVKVVPLCLLLGMIFYTLTLSVFRSNISPEAGFDVKIIRDFLIPIAFFILGMRVTNLKAADSIVFKMTALLFGVALFEYFYLDTYLKVFNVIQYYIARGTLEASSWALEVAGGLMISGLRPAGQGRNLLPFLGDHRVSSLFLEPISLGNFGCIVMLWAVVRSRMTGRFYLWSFLVAGSLIILSDTRFDASFIWLGILVLLLPLNYSTPMAIVTPAIAMAVLIFLDLTSDVDTDDITGLGTYARLLYSGHVLLDFDILNWLGVKVSRLQTFDAGYAYIISNAGLIGLALFWYVLMSLQGTNRYFYAFRNASAVFFGILLCIGESQLTIKTAALHWFLLGTLSVARGSEPDAHRGRVREVPYQAADVADGSSNLPKPV